MTQTSQQGLVTMRERLLQYAIETVWCNPAQDRQHVFKLSRLTKNLGVRGNVNLFYETMPLPTTTDYYHIYQIGAVIPSRLGLPSIARQWISLQQLASDYLLLTDLYVDSGIQFPRFEAYALITSGDNLIIAIRVNDRVHTQRDQNVYMRFYSNAFFDSPRSNGKRYIHCLGLRVATTAQLLNFQHTVFNLVNSVGGYPYYFVNGRFADNISLVTADVGDVVECVLDGSIKRMVEFNINELPGFTSTLDSNNKYILHYDDSSVDTIEYRDDVDVFLYRNTVNTRFLGITYHRNTNDWLRMLTHKDYSIPTGRIETFMITHPTDPRHLENASRWPEDKWTTTAELKLRLYIRHSGYERPLVADSHRIQELYRLDSDRIVGAMTGLDSTLDLWRAEELEQCPYVSFMSLPREVVMPITTNQPDETSPEKEYAQALAGEVFGYHAAATILAGTPNDIVTTSGYRHAVLSLEHQENATIYEYDADGRLLGHYYHVLGDHYHPVSLDCVLIEALSGKGGQETSSYFGHDEVIIPYGYNFRVYITPTWAGNPTNDWIDITEAANRDDYGYLDDTTSTVKWVWTYNINTHYGLVRIDDSFLAIDLPINRENGHLRFNIGSFETHHGVPNWRPMIIPMGVLDVFLNGYSLVEGIDYFVKWPEVVICNREHLTEDTYQNIHYRAYGLCKEDLTRSPIDEIGFLRHGMLSIDGQYDIHTHKVRRVIADGRYLKPNELIYDEQKNDLVIVGVRNGAPYLIQTPPSIFKDVYQLDQVARHEDDLRDKAVSDYMDVMFPPAIRDPNDFIEDRYTVISVFTNKLLYDLSHGLLVPEGYDGHYSDMQVQEWCLPYAWLLEYDICNKPFNQDYINVWPHWSTTPIALNQYQYQFFVRAMNLHLTFKPDISAFINIVSI